MKLSVCVPVYNFDVNPLINSLLTEINTYNISAEVILIDDASNPNFLQQNEPLSKKVTKYIKLDTNIGRSQIRNLFLNCTEGEYLLFLDCDGKVISDRFLRNYLEFIHAHPEVRVIYGGRIVQHESPGKNRSLRWKFAMKRENLPLSKRLKKPYLSFQTNNFIIEKTVFNEVTFNRDFENYGYEDLLFSMDLKASNININHIENPIFNNEVETNDHYLRKVDESIENLAKMLKDPETAKRVGDIKIVKAYNFIEKTGKKKWLIPLFETQQEKIRNLLSRGNASLSFLDLYKLGKLIKKMN